MWEEIILASINNTFEFSPPQLEKQEATEADVIFHEMQIRYFYAKLKLAGFSPRYFLSSICI